jgi:DNA (cytosine-5)-methyltransferase 1
MYPIPILSFKGEMQVRVVDLFAGTGGFWLGFSSASYDVVASVEIDRWACETLRHDSPRSTTILECDIRTLDEERFAS